MSKYFLHETLSGSARFYWRSVQTFAGVPLHLNLNLLAHALGDRPPAGVALVGAENYDTRLPGVGAIQVQPFVELRGTTRIELPIGTNLKNFLDYPLVGMEKMNLSLPFYDGTLGIGDSGGGWFRNAETDGAFHCGWDVMPASQTQAADLFEVCAASDGVVEAISKRKNAPVVLRHTIGGVPFLTVYQHLDLTASPLAVGDTVRRGQFLARIADENEVPDPARPHTRHLHFMAAVRGPSFTLASGVIVPALWYAVDAFGVYDYYLNRTNRQTYNYVPDVRPDCFGYRIQGASHPIQWGAQPLAATLAVSQQTGYIKIVRMQFRCRSTDTRVGVPPREHNQCLVWLEGIDEFFFVPFDSPGGDHTVELKIIDFLSQCFDRGRRVKLEYYPVAGLRNIAAVWAND
jgi:hypothetical protein